MQGQARVILGRGQDLLGALADRCQGGLLLCRTRDHYHRHRRTRLVEPAKGLYSRAVGQVEVQQSRVERVALDRIQGRLEAGRDDDLHLGARESFEAFAEPSGRGRAVAYRQQSNRRCHLDLGP